MSAPLPSDEVAEDFRAALEDLISNDRYQISNLTAIAKDCVEHAEAISRVLQNHIQRAPPARKLPALYVLDSVVKNVGSPYNIYFGRNLHQTFMGAYSQVDDKVRRKLEEMLRTWREPVPGSLSTIPVFPLSSTQNIVDNLNKLRIAVGPPQGYQQPLVPAPLRATPLPTTDYRQTPPPPIHALPARPSTAQFQPPTPAPVPTPQPYQQIQQQQGYGQHWLDASQYQQPPIPSATPQYLQSQTPQYTQRQPTPQPPQPAVPSIDLAQLNTDIDDLTTDAKIDCATHAMDQGAQKKLTTLQTLKEILEAGTSSPGELADIRSSITQQMERKRAERVQAALYPVQPPYAPPQPQYQQPQQYPHYLPQPYPYQQQQQQQHPPTPGPAPTTNLADLLRQHTGQSQAYGHPYAPPPPVLRTPPVMNATPVPAAPAEPPLIAALRAQGLLGAVSTPPQIFTPPIGSYAGLAAPPIEVTFTSASIKFPRPHLVASFLSARPNQCSTCGRRFTSDEPGREKKARHLDWHFKTRMRMMEAEKRGQNRSWYVDEREWIASREHDDDAPEDTNGISPSKKEKKQDDFVRVPSDPALRGASCPIDQEPFQSEWSEELQDFIWKDALKVGGRYYHASCYREVTRDRDKEGGLTPLGAGLRTQTPDSVLGKRKAEEEKNGVKTKMKTET